METRPTWPGWENVRLIGKGSFGAVYEIQRDVFGTLEKAALKVISIPQSESDVAELQADGYDMASISERYNSYLKEIVNEYSLMAALKGNSNIVDCDDLHYTQHEDGIGWDILIKMELLEPVTKVFTGDISEEQAIRLGKDICQALILCKKRNIVHRDIKPQNIFISRDGVFKLGDFGIAKVAESTTTGTKTGTYRYMAPEVYNNRPYGGAADIYSLGMVLYWMLNEKRSPFLPLPPRVPSAQMEEDAKYRRFAGEAIPEPAHGTDALKRIVLKACAFDPENRYKQPEEMLQDLEQLTSVAGEKRSSFVQADLDATILDEEPSGHTNGNQPEPMDEWPETLGEMKKRMDESFRGQPVQMDASFRGQPVQMDASFRGQASQMDTSFHGQPASGAAQVQPYGQPVQSITQFGEFLAPPGQNPVQPGQGLTQSGQGLTQSG
ncbi:MAG: protein kinase, partial [Firmicutes bacterium]|nr:protein kinase [Bacillota bacterium]